MDIASGFWFLYDAKTANMIREINPLRVGASARPAKPVSRDRQGAAESATVSLLIARLAIGCPVELSPISSFWIFSYSVPLSHIY